MKEIKKTIKGKVIKDRTVKVFVSNDGLEFSTKKACENHEARLKELAVLDKWFKVEEIELFDSWQIHKITILGKHELIKKYKRLSRYSDSGKIKKGIRGVYYAVGIPEATTEPYSNSPTLEISFDLYTEKEFKKKILVLENLI